MPAFHGLSHLADDPTFWRVQAGHMVAGSGLRHVTQPVPDQAADIELIVEDTGAALWPGKGVPVAGGASLQ
jgi:hypothetical protein